MNVYDQAHSLAKAIRECEEFKQFDEKRKLVEANPQLNDAINDFMQKQFEVQASQMTGKQPEQEAMQQLQQLSTILMQNPVAAQYLQCQMRFSMMMADVYKIVGEVADFGFNPIGGLNKE